MSEPNGWPPELEPDYELPDAPGLPSGATPWQLSQALGDFLLAWVPIWKAIVSALHYLRGTTAKAAGQAERAADIARDARDEARGARVAALAVLEKLGARLTTPASMGLGPDGLPHGKTPALPMREPGISSHSLEEMVPALAQARTTDEVQRLIDERIKASEEAKRIARLDAADVARKARWKKLAKWVGGVLSAAATGYLASELKHLIHWH